MRKSLTSLAILATIMAYLFPLAGHASEEKKLSAVVDAFGSAIKEKNKEKFLNLFVEGNVSWFGVFSTEEFNKFKGKEGMPGKLFPSSPEAFIDWVVALEGKPMEEFNNIKISTDGEVASVYFDYKFYLDKKVQNWGAESWLLVKSEQGWKIQAVNFSYTSHQ